MKALGFPTIQFIIAGTALLTACEPEIKADADPVVQVGPTLTMVPPIAKSVTIQERKDDQSGDMFIMADFGIRTIQGEFNAIIAGDKGIVLRRVPGMALNVLSTDPAPPYVQYYTNLMALAAESGNYLTELINYISSVNMTAQFIPVQLTIAADYIRRDLLRT